MFCFTVGNGLETLAESLGETYVQTFDFAMSTDEFINGMKKFSEGTFSSALVCHYSLYKALHLFPFTMSIMVKLVNRFFQ